MSFTTNSSNLSGKSTTNAFDVIANSLIVNKNTLLKGDLTVLGNTDIGNVTFDNAFVDSLTVNNFTATNPVPITSGGTGLSTLGLPNQVLSVNPGGTALIYQSAVLTNPASITGTGFTGNPTLNFGLEASIGSTGRGFIRTSAAATAGLFLGTTTSTVLQLFDSGAGTSNLRMTNTSANFTYDSTGSSGVFQVLNGGGGISFTNSGFGTISMATAGGAITLADPTSISGAVNISTAGGIFNLATGAGSTNLTTIAGSMNLTTGAGAISLTTGAGNINLTTAVAGIISITTATAGAINIGANVGAVNLYGSAATIGAPIIYIGTGSAVPIPSILTFACGAVTGITGAWTITTLGFQLNALSISLNSTGTIALNNNTTVGGFVSASGNVLANSGNTSSPTSLNPSVTVYKTATDMYGMDLGYNATTARFRTRIFSPVGNDIALSTHTSTPTSQSNFTDRFIINSTSGLISMNGNTEITGTLNVINGNIFTNQNIVGGIEIINSGNLTLTASSPGNILIRGGSGSTITLPDATTLIVGYVYTVNNNSNNPTIINRHNSGTVGTVPALNLGSAICINNSSPNGQWDLHITGPSAATDWANPGTIGSAVPNTGVFTTLNATSIAAINTVTANSTNLSSTTAINPGVLIFNTGGFVYGMDLGYNATLARYRTRIFCPNSGDADISLATVNVSPTGQSDFTDRLIINGNTGNLTGSGSSSSNTVSAFTYSNTSVTPLFTGAFLAPNMNTNEKMYLGFGKSLSANNSAFIDFTSATVSTSRWSIYTSTTDITQNRNSDITLTTASSNINLNSKTIVNVSASSSTAAPFSVVNTSTNPAFTASVLAPNMDLNSSLFYAIGKSLNTSNSAYLTFTAATIPSSQWSIYNSTTSITQVYNGDITMTGNTVTTGNARVFGLVDPISPGNGVCMGLDAGGYANIQLNGNPATGGYIDFSTNGTDFYTRILGLPGAMNYYANQHIFSTVSAGNPTTLSPSLMVPSRTLTLDASRNFTPRIGGSNTIYNASGDTPTSNNSWTDIDFLFVARQKGVGALAWINQATGFRNDTGQGILVSISFSCQRVSNAFGVTALRLLANNVWVLGVQDASALDALTITGTTYLDPGENLRAQIYQTSGTIVNYRNVYITINTYPLIV